MNLISWKILTVATLGVAIPWLPSHSLIPTTNHSTTYLSQTSQPIFTFKEPERVPAILISADGKKLIGGSRSGTIKIWDLQTGKLLNTLTSKSEGVTSLAMGGKNGQILVSGDIDHTVKVWNLSTGKLLLTIAGHSLPVEAVAISPDSKTLVSGSDDRQIQIWNLQTGTRLRTLVGHSDYISRLAISADGKTLVSGSGGNGAAKEQVKLWNLRTGKLLHSMEHPPGIDALAVSLDNKVVISGSFGQLVTKDSAINTLKLWELGTGKLLRDFTQNTDSIESIILTPDGRTMITGNFNGKIKFWNWRTGELLSTMRGDTSP
ncbi:MAG: WD40 repeat domain-containing protein, partial [Dolichospermum sp.]|nr:WD40 repeat domain-containing protein [Dolichospermum sp.]